MLENNKLFYHLRGLYFYFYPKFLLDKDTILKDVESRVDYAYIKERVDYYNKLESSQKTLDSANYAGWATKNIESKMSEKPPYAKTTIKNFKLPIKGFTYFFDSYEYLRYFKKELEFILKKGDINYNLELPCICKSRPINSKNFNNILLNLDKVRHFRFIDDKIAYENKDDILYFRGGGISKP